MSRRLPRFEWLASATVLGLALLCHGRDAEAFCGFYVSGADGKLFNDATQVVLMREGTRTVLSMQNDYKGPVANFAMVVPVPVVLQKENVKTLSRALFDKVETLSAPRLVEYWEQDPCPKELAMTDGPGGLGSLKGMMAGVSGAGSSAEAPAVKIEARFDVAEYEIVILSAADSGSLDAWLRANKYNIPENAEPALRPYVTAGSKFFVAKVNASKVAFDDAGRAHLSPLRFHYDTDTFQLPVKLGMLNSSGTQDLIVDVLAPNGQRYAVANYPEAVIPTNLDVAESARGSFPAFYAALFDKTLESNPGAVVTEYAWGAQSCDPCPGSVQGLTTDDLASLGADVLPSARMGQPGSSRGSAGPRSDVQVSTEIGTGKIQDVDRVVASLRPRIRACHQSGLASDPLMEGSISVRVVTAGTGDVIKADVASNAGLSTNVTACISGVIRRAHFASAGSFTVRAKLVVPDKPNAPPAASSAPLPDVLLGIGSSFVLTRLHARYASGALANDLVFKVATPMMGGREQRLAGGQLERGALGGEKASHNEFQARYAIRHPWTGPITCEKPVRDRWGGPWPDADAGVTASGPTAATKLAYAPRDKPLGSFFTNGLPDLRTDVRSVSTHDAGPATTPTDGGTDQAATKGRCGCDVVGADRRSITSLVLALGCVAALLAGRRARRR